MQKVVGEGEEVCANLFSVTKVVLSIANLERPSLLKCRMSLTFAEYELDGKIWEIEWSIGVIKFG